MPRPFKSVYTAHPGRSVFDLSYSKLLTCDMGQLIPIMCDEMVPGDKFTIANQVVIRLQPLVAPILHEINCYVHYFFVPYRLLWDDFEDFISGGVDGNDASVLPRWDPTGHNNQAGSLWDYFGFPVDVIPDGAFPLDFPRRAYNKVWNEYYRDETLQTEVDPLDLANDSILLRSWSKDYFTSALPWQQRGTAPALPISGLSSAVFDEEITGFNQQASLWYKSPSADETLISGRAATTNDVTFSTASSQGAGNEGGDYVKANIDADRLNDNVVDLTGLTTFNVSDLRLAFQIQKWMERNARAGVRYPEFLHAHFGVSPRDDRLQRSEYIGGSKSNVIVSEVLQTSETGSTPQGTLAGHGINVSQEFCGKYFAQEYGLVIGLMSIMPIPMYQQGINRQWLRRSKYDFFFPEFANLSEQAIEQAELYATDTDSENLTIFGYQGRYDEMRYKPNMVVGQMRDTFAYWHLGRVFGSAPALNEDFLKCIPDKRIFAAPSEPGFIVSFGNVIKAIRPMPISGEPGLIDHN